jgi:hypothetical protein
MPTRTDELKANAIKMYMGMFADALANLHNPQEESRYILDFLLAQREEVLQQLPIQTNPVRLKDAD